uniref:Uncharacterized protein n=1 Tax=Strigamia maritima TaxID=126957 RepID=T1ITV5_STRMM
MKIEFIRLPSDAGQVLFLESMRSIMKISSVFICYFVLTKFTNYAIHVAINLSAALFLVEKNKLHTLQDGLRRAMFGLRLHNFTTR